MKGEGVEGGAGGGTSFRGEETEEEHKNFIWRSSLPDTFKI